MKEYIERELTIKQLEFGITRCALATTDDEYEEQYKIGAITARQDDISNIKSLPAADVEPVRHGKWIEHDYEHYIKPDDTAGIRPIQYRCNLCGRVENQEEPYCHCGAKMDGGNEQ